MTRRHPRQRPSLEDQGLEAVDAFAHSAAAEELPAQLDDYHLTGPSSQQLVLQGSGQKSISWGTTERRAVELEIRIRILASSVTATHFPIVQYVMEFGHGKALWKTGQVPNTQTNAVPAHQLVVPARGVVHRLSTRDLRLTLFCNGDEAGTAVASNVVQVSFQPVLSSCRDVFPRQQFSRSITDGFCGLPMEAEEMRVRNPTNGQPFAALADTFHFLAFNGGIWGNADAATLADWVPIPSGAVAFTSSHVNYLVEYRS
jgi:hypothetical protein